MNTATPCPQAIILLVGPTGLTWCGPESLAPNHGRRRQRFVVPDAIATQQRLREAFGQNRIRDDWYDLGPCAFQQAMERETSPDAAIA